MTTNARSNTPGPQLLEERTLLGIFAHVFPIVPFGLLVVVAIYVVADPPSPRRTLATP